MMLTPETVISPREKTALLIATILATALWLILTVCTLGIVWLYIALFMVAIWLSNGLMVASLRSEAVEVHPDQLGKLDATFREVCATLKVEKVPELYVLQSGGMLNAFATKHTGRHFVVIFSDMLESFGPDSLEMKFLLGHEIGHINRRHLSKRMLLAPALFFPILGPAYSRSCESTCDRYGALAAGDATASARAMMILAGGKEAGHEMNSHAFAEQNKTRRGFFVSWYEMISGYPTLSRRVRDLHQLVTDEPAASPARHPISYLFALVTFGGGFGGRGSLLTTFIIAYLFFIFGAMMLPLAAVASKAWKTQAQIQEFAPAAASDSADEEASANDGEETKGNQ